MRNFSLLLITLITITFSVSTKAQVAGIKNIPGDYPSLAAAVTALNTSGVGAGGATINIASGYTETASNGGFVLGSSVLNASLSVTNPLTIKKASGTNPLLTAYTGGSSTSVDGIFKILGCDYVTIDGIDLQENAANSGNALMEWGYALVNLNASAPFDGCQSVTIKNCNITLNKANANATFGIYASQHTASSTTALTISATTDAHNNNKFYSNNISNVGFGIYILGYNAPSPYTLYCQNNDIGGSSAATGNTITNFGNITGFNNFGIYIAYNNGGNISFNTVLGAGAVNTTAVTYAIYSFGTNSSFTANNNTITAGQTIVGNSGAVAGIYAQNTGSTTANNNNITFIDAAGSGTHYGIFTSSNGTLNVTGNTLSSTPTGGVTGVYYMIYAGATASGGETISNNNYNNLTLSTTSTVYLIYKSNSTINSTVSNNTVTSFSKTGTAGTVYGYYNFGVPSGGTQTVSGNNFSNISLTGATTFYGVYMATVQTEIQIVNNNTISNVSNGAGTMYGIYFSYGSSGNQVNGNIISNLTGGTTIYGIQIGATPSTTLDVSGNNINNITGTGAASVYGFYHSSGSATNVFKNKIYNISNTNAGGIAYGIYIVGGTTTNIYNNLVGDIMAPASTNTNAVSGLYISAGTTINAYYNTIYLTGTSSGSGFGSSGIYASTTPTVKLIDNLVYNNSFPTGTGRAVAYRRSSTTLITYDNLSNNNLWYAASAPNNGIYYDGTNFDQTLSAFQTRVAPRDAASVTELSTPFTSLVGANANYLHISTTTQTVAESGGAVVTGYTTDYDNDPRSGTTPDIGADEFAGLSPTACSGTPAVGTIAGSGIVCSGFSNILTLSGFSANSGITLQWQSSTTSGGPYSNIAGATGSTYSTGSLATTTYYVVLVSCGANTAATPQFAVVPSPTPTITVNPSSPTVCPGGVGTTMTASGASTYTWSPASGLSATTGATITANPSATTTYTVTGTSAAGCSNTANVTVSLSATISISLNQATGSVCTGGSTSFTATASSASGYSISSITYSPIPTPGSGVTTLANGGTASTPLSAGSLDDGRWDNITLPFTFSLYGTNYTAVNIGTNGWIAMGAVGTTTTGYGVTLPSAGVPNACVHVMTADLDERTVGTVNYFTTGTAPNRQFVVNWSGVGFFSGGGNATFQAILYEGTNVIEVHATSVTNTTTGKSEAVENATGTAADIVTGRNNAAIWSGLPDAYRWSPAAFTYAWYPANGLNTTTGATVSASPTISTSYLVKATQTTTGCSSIATATVLVNKVPTPTVTPTNATICNGVIQTLSVSSFSTAANKVTSSGAIAVTIPDNSATGATNTISVSGIPAGAVVTGMHVSFNLNHTYDGDLIVNLKAPNGNVLNLVNGQGGAGDHFLNTAINSYSGIPAISSGASPFTGVFAPDAALSVGPTGYSSNVINFSGLFATPNGNYTLAIQDAAVGDVGTLTSWTITVYYFSQDNTTWSPLGFLYTNAAATILYTGTNLQTVYAKPTVSTTFVVTANSPGCSSGAISLPVNVNQPPSVVSQPANQPTCAGSTVTFTVTAAGAGPLTYQWRKNGTPLVDGGNISGSATSTLTITNVTAVDAGNYDVVVTGICNPNTTSNVATLTFGPPVINTQPVSQTGCSANTISFSVTATGPGLTYQWRKNGTNLVSDGVHIFGATSNTLTITNVTAADAGNYDVVITNTCGQTVNSAVAILTYSINDRWLGVANSDWNNPNNWCNGVPTPITDVEIPSGTLFPAIVSANSDLRNLQINAGATLTVSPSGWLNIWGTTLTFNGTFNANLGTVGFRNTVNLNLPTLTVANLVMNGTGGVTLTGNLKVDTALTLTSGNITLGNNNVTMTGGTLGSVTSHVVTNGTGVVTNRNINAATAVFPIGASASTYNPLQIANGQGLDYSARVVIGVPGSLFNAARAINRTWTLSSSAAPVSPVQLTFNYADAEGNASYNPATNMEVGYFNGSSWIVTTPTSGVVPFGVATARQTYTTSSNFGPMVVSNVGGILNIVTGAPTLNTDIFSVKMLPNLVNNQSILRVNSRRAMNVEWSITDLQGKLVMKFNKSILAGQNDINLKLGHLASGSYQLVGYTDKGTTGVIQFVRL